MSNLIIAYPEITLGDYDRIQRIREKSDPRYFSVVRPHVTLVFGTNKLDTAKLLKHAEHTVSGHGPVKVVLDRAQVVEDDSGEFFHTFLVPSEGYEGIIQLHDRLYTGDLEGELRHDIPFIPHVGIGTSDSKEEMDELAEEINSSGMTIEGTIAELSIVEYNGQQVVDRDKLVLA